MDFNQQLAQLQAQLGRLQQAQQMLSQPVATPAQPVAQQSSAPAPVEGQEALLLRLYDEFVKTDEGKQLAANLARFARFAQSKAAKESQPQQ